eukprot:2856171-Pyramimonas_sp.AAC.1
MKDPERLPRCDAPRPHRGLKPSSPRITSSVQRGDGRPANKSCPGDRVAQVDATGSLRAHDCIGHHLRAKSSAAATEGRGRRRAWAWNSVQGGQRHGARERERGRDFAISEASS